MKQFRAACLMFVLTVFLIPASAQDRAPVFEAGACPTTMPPGVTVECGEVIVPEDRSDPNSPDIRLSVAIFRNPDAVAGAEPSSTSMAVRGVARSN